MKLLMLGDVCPTKVNSDLFKAKDITALFGDTPELFKEKDHVFVNLECALTESDSPIEKFGPNLKAPEETAEVLASLGVDICGLSNNHVLDFGMPGIRDTFAALERAGISRTGFGEDLADSRRGLVLEKAGEKVAIIAVCEHGSTTKAAEALYLVQPTVSHSISELEKYYKVTLFDRVNQRLILTEAGKV